MKHQALRPEIVAACLAMNARGINQGTSGNISARIDESLNRVERPRTDRVVQRRAV